MSNLAWIRNGIRRSRVNIIIIFETQIIINTRRNVFSRSHTPTMDTCLRTNSKVVIDKGTKGILDREVKWTTKKLKTILELKEVC